MKAVVWHGVYIGLLDKIPMGAAHGKGLTLKMGQTHMQRYLQPLLEKIEGGEIDPSFIISHRVSLEDAPVAYEKFRKKEDSCTKVVIKPGAHSLYETSSDDRKAEASPAFATPEPVNIA